MSVIVDEQEPADRWGAVPLIIQLITDEPRIRYAPIRDLLPLYTTSTARDWKQSCLLAFQAVRLLLRHALQKEKIQPKQLPKAYAKS